MSDERERLQRLRDLAGLIRDRELERLRRETEARADVEAEAAALRSQTGAASAGPDPAWQGAAEARWHAWRRDRLAALATEAAAAAARTEAQRARARIAFGRASVLGRLAEPDRRRR